MERGVGTPILPGPEIPDVPMAGLVTELCNNPKRISSYYFLSVATLSLLAACNGPTGTDSSCVVQGGRFQCDDLTIEFRAISVAWQGQEPSSGMIFITIELSVNPANPLFDDPFDFERYALELSDASIWPAEGLRLPILAVRGW